MPRTQHREFTGSPAENVGVQYRPPAWFAINTLATDLGPFFAAQMDSPVRVRCGLVFVYREDGVTYVLLAGATGISNWYTTGLRTVFDIDLGFALGWSEARPSVAGTGNSWVGNWTVHANGRLNSPERDVRRFRSAIRSGLIDAWSILPVVAFAEGMLKLRALPQGSVGAPDF